MASDLDIALAAARAGAAVISEAFGRTTSVEFKGAVDPVTAVDRSAETALLDVLRSHRPHDALLSEEAGGAGWGEGRVWIADPLDGTVNFLHGFPQVSVSVALWEDGSPLVGVVIDVTRDEVFTAVAGEGARLDCRPIAVSTVDDPARALIATGFPYDRQRHAAAYLPAVEAVLTTFQGVRRLGSAALDLCWVAVGRIDGYYEFSIKPWDAAAGVLIATEAGALAWGPTGDPHRLDDPLIVTAAPGIQGALFDCVATRIPEHLR